jgi:SPP1 gp7 family putative phage head morphogenesis protein
MAGPLQGISDDPVKFEEAIRAIRARVPMTDETWDLLQAEEREFAFTVANVAQLDLVADVYDAITRAVEDGTTLEDFKADVGARLEASWGAEAPGRVETIFRTNVMGSYNAGRHEAAQALKKTRPYWRYEAVVDSRTSEICRPCDGVILDADSSWWRTHYPPMHPNCRCQVTTLTEDQAQAAGITSSPPSVQASDGFGKAPSAGGGGDWEPDPDAYPDALGEELSDALTG